MKIWVLLSRTNMIEGDGTGVLESVFWEQPGTDTISLYLTDREKPETPYLNDCFTDIADGVKTLIYGKYYWIQSFEHD